MEPIFQFFTQKVVIELWVIVFTTIFGSAGLLVACWNNQAEEYEKDLAAMQSRSKDTCQKSQFHR